MLPTRPIHNDAYRLPAKLLDLCRDIARANGRGWLVGGCVRDMLLGLPAIDFDLEVFGIPAGPLHALLGNHGRTIQVGKQFGVVKLWIDQLEIDVALPRTERKTADGHTGFNVECDPGLSPEIATLRRDFTINAMMYDPLDHYLLDMHQGQEDLKSGILRHVSPAFIEDPLRPLRAMQFAARFAMRLHPETAGLCASMLNEASTLPASRIWAEWKKWALAESPSYGLRALAESCWLSLYPELQAMTGCPQDPRWHPEGDVWNHTLLCCDQVPAIAKFHDLNPEENLQLQLATLCHDLGKPACTAVTDQGAVRSPGHSEAGMMPASQFLRRIAAPGKMIEMVLPLIREHITHLHGQPTQRSVRRLANRLSPASIRIWEMLVQADASGRCPAPPSRPAKPWLEMAEKLAYQHEKPRPILNGDMLIQKGYKPGPHMGKILAAAYEAQLDGHIYDHISASAWLKEYSAGMAK